MVLEFKPRPKKQIVSNKYIHKFDYMTRERQFKIDQGIQAMDLPVEFKNNTFNCRVLWAFDLTEAYSDQKKAYINDVNRQIDHYEEQGLTPPAELIVEKTKILEQASLFFTTDLFTFRDRENNLWWALFLDFLPDTKQFRYIFAKTNEDDDYMVRHQQMEYKTLFALSDKVYDVLMSTSTAEFGNYPEHHATDITNSKEEWLPSIPSELFVKNRTVQLVNDIGEKVLIGNYVPKYAIELDNW
jgi:hypothetical protein